MTAESALTRLEALPGVADGIAAAREACTHLRWHPALRRRTEEVRVEATIRAARCSAALEGARLPLELVRDAARGAAALPDDAVGRVVSGALRAVTEARALEGTVARSPAQALARLHVAAAAGSVPDDDLGRPRQSGREPGTVVTARLSVLADLLQAPRNAPALLLAAVAHAEVITAEIFPTGNGVVARALARSILVSRGLDITGVAVWEGAHLQAGPQYAAALAGYADGSREAVAAWLVHCAWAVVEGTREGREICDAVVAGSLG